MAGNRAFKGKSLIEFPDNFIVVDLETTGLDPEIDEIIQIGAIKIQKDKITDKFNRLVKPSRPISDFITELTGITNEDLDKADDIKDVLPLFLDFIGDNILIGHNVNFDINFIYDNSLKILNTPFKNDFVDTLRIARKLLKQLNHHRLDDLIEYYNLEEREEHQALNDCELTLKIYKNMLNKIEDIETFKKSFNYWYNYNPVKAKDITGDVTLNDEEHILYSKNCVITGKLDKLTRKEAMQLIANIGGINQDRVTKTTNFLILGNNDYCKTLKGGKSSKQKKAEEYKLKGQDIEIISENVFYDLTKEIIDSKQDNNTPIQKTNKKPNDIEEIKSISNLESHKDENSELHFYYPLELTNEENLFYKELINILKSANINTNKIKLMKKAQNYITLVDDRNYDILRFKLTQKTKWVSIYMTPENHFNEKNNPIFDAQKNKGQLFWKSKIKNYKDTNKLKLFIIDSVKYVLSMEGEKREY